jgi:23S rRNA pseudouridine2605 synthase
VRVQGERLQKVLATAGVGSRRQCEELILAGRVDVDGSVVTELGTRVDPDRQRIRLDGVRLSRPKRVCYALNKPPGVVCTNRDPSGRPRAVDLIPAGGQRLFTVGRLDLSSEGLILVTNDGELANQLAHPRYGVRKTYRVLVAGHPTRETVAGLRRGVRLAEGMARVADVQIKRRHKQNTMLEMVLDEGRNREIRRVLARLGHKVLRLVRVAIGPIRLGNLPPGAYRRLRLQEIRSLHRAAKETGRP